MATEYARAPRGAAAAHRPPPDQTLKRAHGIRDVEPHHGEDGLDSANVIAHRPAAKGHAAGHSTIERTGQNAATARGRSSVAASAYRTCSNAPSPLTR